MSLHPRTFCSALSVVLCLGCGSELTRSARSDSLHEFRSVLAAKRESGELGRSEIEDAALAVAVRELLSNTGDAGVARVNELAACATELLGPLRDVSQRSDASGGAATQVLIDLGKWGGSLDALVDKYAKHPDPAWRAVGARAAVASEHRDVRIAGYLDGDLRVRRAALRAAGTASDPSETSELLETARLDPDAVSRRFALHALSAIADPGALGRLRDVWIHADEDGRRAITHAWGGQRAYGSGGEGHLMWVASTQSGLPQLAAAVILVQNRAVATQQALAVLVRAIEQGAPEEQRYAIAFAPLSVPGVREALHKALDDDDAWTEAIAASALLRVSTAQVAARARLRELLNSKRAEAARQARLALAFIRDPIAVQPLTRALASEQLELRLEAGRLLMWLEEEDVAAALLADPAASVRTHFACAVLSAEPPRAEHYPNVR